MKLNTQTQHRPWPLPPNPWIMRQEWHDLLFCHWSLPPELLRPLIPPALELDLWGGRAYIGVVPFRMQGIRPRGLCALPWISAFPELNLRTYVRHGQKPGVYFFSLEAANPVAVRIARRAFHLPYYDAQMRCEWGPHGWIDYSSRRTHRGGGEAVWLGTYRPRPRSVVFQAQPGTLDHWLTERYALYSVDAAGRAFRGEIHHLPWPLQSADARIAENSLTAPLGFGLPDEAPLLHYVAALVVNVWPLVAV